MNSEQFIGDIPYNRKVRNNYFRSKNVSFINRMTGKYPAMIVNQTALDSLMGINTEQLNKTILSKLKQHISASGFANTKVSFKLKTDQRIVNSQNVIGIIKGKNENKSLVISAHYDDLFLSDTLFYPGANDNASGTAAIIELANSFSNAAKSGIIPNQTIVFAAFSGEENGMFGSE
jgi:Zn-dependent M28 family amino/carboxypeptidase